MKKIFSTITFLLLASFMIAQNAVITAWHDGDSPKLNGDNKTVRLANIDANEVYSPYVTANQPFGKEAGDTMRILFKGDTVRVDSLYQDTYKRWVVNIYLADGSDLALHAVMHGLARYTPHKGMSKAARKTYREAEKFAREQGFGLWNPKYDKAPYGPRVTPATWRAKHKPIPIQRP